MLLESKDQVGFGEEGAGPGASGVPGRAHAFPHWELLKGREAGLCSGGFFLEADSWGKIHGQNIQQKSLNVPDGNWTNCFLSIVPLRTRVTSQERTTRPDFPTCLSPSR